MSTESCTIQSGPLRAEFWFEADRFLQRLLWTGGDEPRELLRSCEPTPPLAGPVFQEVYKQDSPAGGELAFLTGMADGRYWSASVDAAGPGSQPRFGFDYACRLKQALGHVAAEYRVAEGVGVTARQGEAQLAFDSASVTIRPVALAGHAASQLMLAERVVMLAPGEGFEGDPRWAFEVAAG